MKRLLLLLALVLLVLPVQAGFSYNFQTAGEELGVGCTGTCTYTDNKATGGNSYYEMRANGVAGPFDSYIRNGNSEATTYASARLITYSGLPGYGVAEVYFYSGSWYSWNLGYTPALGKYEVIVISGRVYLYINGVAHATSYAVSNPTYVGFGVSDQARVPHSEYAMWDDFIYGSTLTTNIFGNPSSTYTIVKKDLINPANSGLARASDGVVIDSNNMTTTYGRGNFSGGLPIPAKTLTLLSFTDGSVRDTRPLPANSFSGSVSWALDKAFFDTDLPTGVAPYGAYTTYVVGDSYYPNIIYYVGYGATVTLDAESYARGDTATATYSVTAGYWLPATYTYTLEWMDLYGNTLKSDTLSTDSGSSSYTFPDDAAIGTYFAVLKATPTTGSAVWMGFDSAALGAYIGFSGWPNDAETMLPIPGARVNFMQSGVANYITTFTTGNYSTNASYLTGAEVIIDVNATGYRGKKYNFTPLKSDRNLNFTLWPNPPTVTGISLGGVAVEGDGRGSATNIPPRPIPNATVTIKNLTHGESYTVLGNKVGAWLLDETKGAFLTSNRLYHIEGDKAAYHNSSIYKKVVAG